MLPLTSSSSTALLVLQQADERSRSGQRAEVAVSETGSAPFAGAPLPIGEMGSVTSPDLVAMKTHLTERLGDRLGLSLDDFDTASGFGRELKRLVDRIATRQDGDLAIMRFEHELGLDRLGVPLGELVDAMIDPEGGAAARLGEALLREAGDGSHASGRPRIDEIGLYSF